MQDIYGESMSNAQMAFANGRYDTALELCQQAIVAEPLAESAYALAGAACLAADKLSEAETYYQKAVTLDVNNGERYFDLGNCFFGQKRFGEALEQYAKADQLGCAPAIQQKLYYLLGVLNQMSGNDAAALLNYDRSNRVGGVNPDQEDILLKQIEIYVDRNDMPRAEECARQLKLLIPGEFRSYQLLFQILLQERKDQEAEEVLAEAQRECTAISSNPESRTEMGFNWVRVHCFRAEMYPSKQAQHYQAALDALAALQKGSDLTQSAQWEIVVTMAEIWMKQNEPRKAQALVRDIAASQETDPAFNSDLLEYVERARYILLECSALLQDYKAVSHYAALLKKSNTLFYQYHGYYSEASAAKLLANAEPSPQRQKDAERLYHLAVAYFRNRNVLTPGDLLAYFYRARLYVDHGDYTRAREMSRLLPPDDQKTLEGYILQQSQSGNQGN